eukprot:5534-Heterococcus_DN1.PRE.1
MEPVRVNESDIKPRWLDKYGRPHPYPAVHAFIIRIKASNYVDVDPFGEEMHALMAGVACILQHRKSKCTAIIDVLHAPALVDDEAYWVLRGECKKNGNVKVSVLKSVLKEALGSKKLWKLGHIICGAEKFQGAWTSFNDIREESGEESGDES